MPIIYRRHARARNYVLRLFANKTVVVTVPRAGTMNFARDFVASRKRLAGKAVAHPGNAQHSPAVAAARHGNFISR